MKYSFLILICITSLCKGQEVILKKISADSVKSNENLYLLKIFNNASVPLAIKSSMSFPKYSERDTLRLYPGTFSSNDSVYVSYGIHESFYDHQSLEPNPYQILIIAPETYLITYLNLTDLNSRGLGTVKFLLSYTFDISESELKQFSQKNSIMLSSKKRQFSIKTIDVRN